jgi:hypothetical protein
MHIYRACSCGAPAAIDRAAAAIAAVADRSRDHIHQLWNEISVVPGECGSSLRSRRLCRQSGSRRCGHLHLVSYLLWNDKAPPVLRMANGMLIHWQADLQRRRTEMLETKVIGNKAWAMAFLTEADIRCLEDFDCEMRIRCLQQKQGREKAKTYEKVVEEHGNKMPTHCEHGIALNRKCALCRALYG